MSGDAPWSMGAVCRATGLGEHTLRVWERRFGFPRPERLGSGHRRYPSDQVERLALIARALSCGHRAGAVVPLPAARLAALLGDASPTPGRADLVASLHAAVRALDRDALARELRQGFARHGASRYLQHVVVPLLEAVGAEWARGRLDIRHEHLASEAVEDVLRELRRALDQRAAGRPVLLATLPGEDHTLGLHMAALLGALADRPVHVLGARTPVAEIAAAARELEAAAVGVPVSAAAAPRATGAALRQLAAALQPGIRLWAGGAGARRLAVPTGVERIADLGRLESALERLPA